MGNGAYGRLVVPVVVILVLTNAAFAAPALADPGRAKLQADALQLPGGGQIEAGLGVIDSEPTGGRVSNDGHSSGPGPSTQGGTTGAKGLITYVWVATGLPCWYGEDDGETVDGSRNGEIYERLKIDRTTEPPSETLIIGECFDPIAAPVTPPPPPPPPTLEEIAALARELIIVPDVQLSPEPDVGGVTGLETWFWYEGQEEATVSVTIRGYAVTATMHPSRYYWHPGDPRGSLLEAHQPGSEDEPAATWVYETKDHYDVRVQVVWDGTWSFAGHGATASGDLPTIRATGSTAYRVDEVRSELTRTR